jgi:hypothetical protein
MDRIATYIQILQGTLDVPLLKKRSDIWDYFPVNSKPLGRGTNKADRHGIEWHMSNLRAMAKQTNQPIESIQKLLLPSLLSALRTSPYWQLEESNNTTYIAKIAMRFEDKTRKNVRNIPAVVEYRKWNTGTTIASSPPKPVLPEHTKSANKSNSTRKNSKNNAARRAITQKYFKKEADHIRQIRQIVNKLSKDNQEKLMNDLVSILPQTDKEWNESIDVIVQMALNTQAYHPLFIAVLHKLNTIPEFKAPAQQFADSFLTLFHTTFSDPTFLKPETQGQKLKYRCFLLFAGYLYREGFMKWSAFQTVLQKLGELI